MIEITINDNHGKFTTDARFNINGDLIDAKTEFTCVLKALFDADEMVTLFAMLDFVEEKTKARTGNEDYDQN